MNLQETMHEIKALRDEATAIKARAASEGRECRPDEHNAYNAKAGRIMQLEEEARNIYGKNSLVYNLGGNFANLLTGGSTANAPGAVPRGQKPMSTEYNEAFLAFLRSGGKQTGSALSEGFDPLFGGFALPAMKGMSAALYEGTGGSSTTAGGYAVSIPTDSLIVPLGLPDIGVRSVARVIPTATDIKIPAQTSFGTAGIKAESGSSSNQFVESDPALSQFTLSAFMIGLTHTVSWELLQDVQMFQEFGVRDLINAIDIAEDGFFVTGTGTNQPQGLIGNVGAGVTGEVADASGNLLSIQATFDVLGTLKGTYFRNASWLMQRATGVELRKAQAQANLFYPVFTSVAGRDYLHGFPVAYSSTMPAIAAGATPVLFGDFQDGYVIGDRGSGTFIKIIDQVLAMSGQTVLLGYKRTDGRVRRSEAIQGITLHT